LGKKGEMMIDWSYDKGWDSSDHNGGILYFMDVEGFDPV